MNFKIWLSHINCENLKFIFNIILKFKFFSQCDSTNELVKNNKFHLSLAPIPINVHPFKLEDISIFTCMYDHDHIEVSFY